jgi:GntR family transcriptional regulator
MKTRLDLENTEEIHKDSALPLYHQLIERIRKEIESGRWQPGQQIPSEAEICEHFDISRAVVRQAVRELEFEGLLIREQGKGTFVAQPAIAYRLAQSLLGLYEDMAAKGTAPVSEILKKGIEKAPANVADSLQIDAGNEVLVIERLRYVNNEPLVLVTNYLPHNLCNEILEADLKNRSLYALLETQCGFSLSHGQRTIQAVAADARQAKLLRVKRGDPLISFDGVTYLKDGRPIEFYHSVHRGDRSKFEVQLVRDG